MKASAAEGSTVPRRQLGRELRKLREQAAITVAQAADTLEWSGPKIWRIEKGVTSMRALDVEAMCRVYGAPPKLTDALMSLARETKSKGWWHAYGASIPGWFELYIGLEQAASAIRCYETELVPGLLQTADYATAVIRAGNPDLNPDEVDRRVMARLHRQRLLSRPEPIGPPRLDAILSEAVLRRTPPNPEVAHAQLRHLIEVARRPAISVMVLPFEAGLHRASRVPAFTVLDFPINRGKLSEPTTVYTEGLTGALYLDEEAELAQYEAVWAAMVDTCLSEADSIAMIKERAEELTWATAR